MADYREKLQEEHLLDGHNYSGSSKVVWGNTQRRIETDTTFDLLVSSPPYGDNHTTVTYGQTSYLPLQWIDPKDIECPYNYLRTTQEIDRRSLGGRIDRSALSQAIDGLFIKTPTLAKFYDGIPPTDKMRYKKTLSFIADFDESLDAIMKVMKPNAFYIFQEKP